MAEANEVRGAERSAEEIRQDIAAKRESISNTVGKLGEKIQDKLDWRGYVTRHPYASMGVAAGAGFLVAGMIQRKTSPRQRIMNAVTDAIEDIGADVQKSIRRMIVKKGTPMVAQRALFGALSAAIINLINSRFADGGRAEPSVPSSADVHSNQKPNPSAIL